MLKNNIITAYLLDGKGGGKKLSWKEVEQWSPDQGILWLHLDADNDKAKKWLQSKSNLDPLIVEILLAEDTRPRFLELGPGFLLILKGLNINPSKDPEDMVSLRVWSEQNRIISVCKNQVWSIIELEKWIDYGQGPKNSSSFSIYIAKLLLDKMEPMMDLLDERMDSIEMNFQEETENLLSIITDSRVKSVTIRRHLIPLKEAITQMQTIKIEWFDKKYKKFLHEHLDRINRFIEDLQLVKDRATILLDEIRNRMQGKMAKTMYIFSLVAVLFLPLTFITGLFGINVGGIPGAETKLGFTIFCTIIVVFTALLLFIFRRLRWF